MVYQQALTAIKSLSHDNVSGATEIERRAVKTLTYFISCTDDDTLYSFRNKISNLCIKLIQAQPSMASLFNLSNDILNFSNATESVQEIKRSLHTYFTQYHDMDSLIQCAEKILSDKSLLATHSRSSTVLTILKKINHDLHVICTESRPLNEGHKLASELSSFGVKVTLVVDTAIFSLLDHAQCVLVGADAITPLGVINKIGTKGIASVAKDKNKPCYVAASLHKLCPFSLSIPLKDSCEVWRNPPDDISIKNFYFDITPLSQIDTFITEKGPLNASLIKKKIQSIKIAPQLLFIAKQCSTGNYIII